MGWSSGSELASKMIELIDYLYDDKNEPIILDIYHDMIVAFEDCDCDSLHECIGESSLFDKAYKEMYPELYQEIVESYYE